MSLALVLSTYMITLSYDHLDTKLVLILTFVKFDFNTQIYPLLLLWYNR